MQKKWKKTGVALMVATLTVSGASYAWAADEFDTVSITDVMNKQNKGETTADSSKDAAPKTEFSPSYTSKKLIGLFQAYEKAGTDEAKAAIKQVIDRQISEYENFAKSNTSQSETVVFLSKIVALAKSYENATTDEARASIKQSIQDTIKQFKATWKKPVKEQPKAEKPEKNPSIVAPVVSKEAKKEEKRALKDQRKLEKKAKKAKEKAEKPSKKHEHKHKHEHKKEKKHHKHGDKSQNHPHR